MADDEVAVSVVDVLVVITDDVDVDEVDASCAETAMDDCEIDDVADEA